MKSLSLSRWFTALAIALIVALACGIASAQKRGGTMVIAITGEPNALVGFLHTDTGGYIIASNIWSGLVGMNDNFEPTPNLAERWEVSPDGRTYKFFLNPRAKFHDGKPVTAYDAEFSFNEIISKYHPSRDSWWPNVEYTKALDDHTFVIQLKKPFAPLMALLAYELRSGALIYPKHIYAGTDAMKNPANEKPIGSGPFKFVRWAKGSHVELTRNPDYFMPGRPYLDRLVVQFVPDAATRILAFERGEVDFIDYTAVPLNDIKRIEGNPKFKVLRGKDAIAVVGMWLFNMRHPTLKDVRVRQALYYALDMDYIADKSLFGAGRPAHSFVSSNLAWAYDAKPFVYKRDVARANKMLDDAGYRRGADGTRFKINVMWAAGRAYDGKAAELVRDQLRDVGVNVEVVTYDRPTFIDKVFAKWEFDSAMQLISTGPDPAISVVTRYHTKQINRAPFTNAMGYSNPELDKIFDADASELDKKKRSEYWHKAQAILMRELPGIPVFQFPDGHLVNARLERVVTGPYGYFQSRHEAYVK